MILFEYFEQGGFIMYILLFLNIIGFSILLYKTILLLLLKKNHQNLINSILYSLSSKIDTKVDEQLIIQAIEKELSYQLKNYESGLDVVKIIATISPLLGLLGTVIGVFISFESISKQGLGDPSIFAEGISLALITTIGGLVVAIPHYIGYNFLISMIDNIEAILEKKIILQILENK
ncbi:MAG: MotA/TolQ/ExbB proton channel family protein [Campylobacterales bacterium]|nr:MotA/TolQ/ExbB proton channel family protein [Campylobacterales bacterium]